MNVFDQRLKPSSMAHPWRPTAGIFFANGATFGIWATQIPLVRERLDLDTTVLGVLLLVLGAGAVTAMAASGYLIRRFGSAALTRFSAAAFIALLPLTAIAPSLLLLAPVLFAFGAAGGSMDVAMNAHAAEVERHASRVYMSSFHGMWSMGGLIGAGLGSLMLAVMPGPVQAVIAALVIGAVAAASQGGLLPQVATPEGHTRAHLRPDVLALVIGTMAAVTFAAEGSVLDWSSLYMRSALGAPPELVGFGYAAFSAAMAAGRFVGDRIRRRYGAAAIIRGGAILAALGLFVAPATGSVGGAIVGFALTGLGLSNVVPVLISAAGAMRNGDVAIATVTTLGYGGLLAAPPLLGFVADATSLATMFVLVAALCIVVAAGSGVVRSATARTAAEAAATGRSAPTS
jgi:predicted MFS family arabinose efflux permease